MHSLVMYICLGGGDGKGEGERFLIDKTWCLLSVLSGLRVPNMKERQCAFTQPQTCPKGCYMLLLMDKTLMSISLPQKAYSLGYRNSVLGDVMWIITGN